MDKPPDLAPEVRPGEMITKTRRKLGLTRKQLAEESGTDAQTIPNIELGKVDPWEVMSDFLAVCNVLSRKDNS